MQTIVVATVGLCGTGKSETTRYIGKSLGFETVYFGGQVLEQVRQQGLEVNKDNEKMVRERLRAEQGMAVMAKLSLPRIKASLEAGTGVVIDGLYSYAEYVFLKQELGDSFYVVAIHVPKPLRYQRLGARPVRPLSADQVDERDLAEIRNLEKSDPIVLADYHLVNDASMEKLHQRVDRVLGAITGSDST